MPLGLAPGSVEGLMSVGQKLLSRESGRVMAEQAHAMNQEQPLDAAIKDILGEGHKFPR